jgi:hypothetical protein
MRNISIFALSLLGWVGTAPAAEVVISEAHLGVTLPDSWHQVAEKKVGILLRAEADGGLVRFMLTRPPIPNKPERMDTAKYQQGVKDALRDNGFPKVVRSELIKVAGADAYLCEVTRDDKPHSLLQVAWFHEGVSHSLVFVSLSKPFKDLADIQKIIKSVKVLPKE